MSLRSALNSWTTPRVASSVTSRVQVCDLCFAVEFYFFSSLSDMAFDFPPRDMATFEYKVTSDWRTKNENEWGVCGWKWTWNECTRATHEERTRIQQKKPISGQYSAISRPTLLAEELRHCHNESKMKRRKWLYEGDRLTRLRKTVKVDDILCLLESEREARRLR